MTDFTPEFIVQWDHNIEQERDKMKSQINHVLMMLYTWGVKDWSLDAETYSSTVLPLLSAVMLQGEDSLCQETVLTKVIEGFSVPYLLSNLEMLLDTVTSANPDVNIKSMIITLMDRLTTHTWVDTQADPSMFN